MKKNILMLAAILIAASVSVYGDEAKKLWQKDCARCHGAAGKGDTKVGKKLNVKDYSDPKIQEKLKDDDMAKVIKEGKVEEGKTRMKAFKDLTDEEVKALVAHIRAFKK